MENINNQKPCVVQTPQGFSVSYKNHLLYSKYNPSKLILQTIEKLNVMPGTVFLCCSPVLNYGLSELIKKLPENCLLILCESNQNLYDFEKSCQSLQTLIKETSAEILIFPKIEELNNFPVELYKIACSGKYKRLQRIDFSAGTMFNPDFYTQMEKACSDSIMTFWKNRLTLTKFGRKYSHNLFTNLKILAETTPITNYFCAVSKPIIVFGAGQSVDSFFANCRIDLTNYYVLCVDTVLSSLLVRKINVDGVFVEEAQTVISKAFIGALNKTHLFAGLSSLPSLPAQFNKDNISFFRTKYSEGNFFNQLSTLKALPPENPPFGSVGLTAVYYALKFRKSKDVPVYVCGLDFSYSPGITHCKNTLAHVSRLNCNNRLTPVQNYAAAFNSSSIKISDKQNFTFITTPVLLSYAQLFNNLFDSVPNLYDCGLSGIPLSIQNKQPENTGKILNETGIVQFSDTEILELNNFLAEQKSDLQALKRLLTEKQNLSAEELKSQIIKKAGSKEYLFLHFADGYSFNYSQSFLNRIRTEIDFFLKLF